MAFKDIDVRRDTLEMLADDQAHLKQMLAGCPYDQVKMKKYFELRLWWVEKAIASWGVDP